MGMLNFYNIGGYVKNHGLEVFIETGVGNGDGIIEAAKHPFQKIISIEIMEAQVLKMRQKFAADPRIEIIHGHTLDVLPRLLDDVKENCLFWLDAHFPGADIGMGKHDDPTIDDIVRLPLEEELFMVRDKRKGKDVVLFDDLLIYQNQGRDCWRNDIRPRHKFTSDNFFAEILSTTHNFNSWYRDTGYAALTPKS